MSLTKKRPSFAVCVSIVAAVDLLSMQYVFLDIIPLNQNQSGKKNYD